MYQFTTLYASRVLRVFSNFDYLGSQVLFSTAFVPKEPSARNHDVPISVAKDVVSRLSLPILNSCHIIVTLALYLSNFRLVAYNVNYQYIQMYCYLWNIIITIVIINILRREIDQLLNHHSVKNQAPGFLQQQPIELSISVQRRINNPQSVDSKVAIRLNRLGLKREKFDFYLFQIFHSHCCNKIVD